MNTEYYGLDISDIRSFTFLRKLAGSNNGIIHHILSI